MVTNESADPGDATRRPGTPVSDAQIAACLDLDEEIRRGRWGGAERLSISVTDGVVKLDGFTFNEGLRSALCVAAQNIPGVEAVEDRPIWVKPFTGMSFSTC